jgi:nucleotide-binding universal stress UspA family protein
MDIFKNILVSIDFKAKTEQAKIDRVLELMWKDESISLTFIYIAPEVTPDPETSIVSSKNQQESLVKHAQERLDILAASFKDDLPLDNKITCVVKIGKPSVAIIQQVLQGKHDLLLVSTRDKTFADNLLGNTTMEIMRRCPCPIWAVKPDPVERKKIMIGIHFDEKIEDRNEGLNQELLRLAMMFKSDSTREIHLVNVISKATPEQHEQYVSDLEHFAKNVDDSELKVIIKVLEGDVTTMLPDYEKQNAIALLVLGMLSRTGLKGFFIGNTAEKILNDIDCSVLTVKPKSFVSPVSEK